MFKRTTILFFLFFLWMWLLGRKFVFAMYFSDAVFLLHQSKLRCKSSENAQGIGIKLFLLVLVFLFYQDKNGNLEKKEFMQKLLVCGQVYIIQ